MIVACLKIIFFFKFVRVMISHNYFLMNYRKLILKDFTLAIGIKAKFIFSNNIDKKIWRNTYRHHIYKPHHSLGDY